jgi:hypothetical protein
MLALAKAGGVTKRSSWVMRRASHSIPLGSLLPGIPLIALGTTVPLLDELSDLNVWHFDTYLRALNMRLWSKWARLN